MTTRHERQRDVRDRAYVGDGVYVSHDGGQLWLTTEDGRGRLHEIALAPEVLEQLMNYRTFLRKRSMAGAAAGGTT